MKFGDGLETLYGSFQPVPKPACRVMDVINLEEKLARFQDYWSPKIVGELNDHTIKLVKVKGEFVMHHHENEDELFLVLKGALRLHLRDQELLLRTGEMIVVPRGVEHKTAADEETHVLTISPRSLLNTGNVRNEKTVDALDCL
jgi:mannose-6-phosphate isomerase-like protein (cupin superfamily)